MSNKIGAASIFVLSIVLSIAFFIFRDFFKESASLGLIGLFILNFVSNASFFVSAPAFPAVVAGGNLYPPILVALVSSLGATAGDSIGFAFGFAGHKLTKHKLEKKKWFRILEKHFKKYRGWLLFAFALIPNPVFDAIGLIAGIFAYPFFRFFLIVLLGRLIRYYLLASFGSTL
jgi:membrane protein YqaA with SNARE-associated domain